MSKRVVVPELRSPLENRKFQKMVTDAKAGQVSACTRHLGGQYNRTGANVPELEVRLQKISSVWCELGKFWTSEAPFKAKRNAFIGSVQGAALSGMTSYTLSKNEKKKLDSKLLGLLRCMLEGAAYDSIAGTSLTNCGQALCGELMWIVSRR